QPRRHPFDQPRYELCLSDVYLAPAFVLPKPFDPIDLGEFPLSSIAWRPFHNEAVADREGRVDVAFDRPTGHRLAGRLLDLAELDGHARRRRLPRLFGELPTRHLERLFVRLDLALGQAPRSEVLAFPVRSARV